MISRLICVLGRIKQSSLVGEHKIYPLKNFLQYSAYKMGFWLLHRHEDGFYTILNVIYVKQPFFADTFSEENNKAIDYTK